MGSVLLFDFLVFYIGKTSLFPWGRQRRGREESSPFSPFLFLPSAKPIYKVGDRERARTSTLFRSVESRTQVAFPSFYYALSEVKCQVFRGKKPGIFHPFLLRFRVAFGNRRGVSARPLLFSGRRGMFSVRGKERREKGGGGDRTRK